MRELSLFSGAGGGLLGTALLGWRPVGYVENNDYCQRVIAARIKDGILPEAPIFGNIETFISDGYASAYKGLVDVVTGGFPCQPFSVAGRRRGEQDERNKWPETIAVIRLVGPQFILLENVPALINSGYFGRVLGDLAESGFDARWKVISAGELGAPHRRDRLWIICYTKCKGLEGTDRTKLESQNFTRSNWWLSEPSMDRVANGLAFRMERTEAIGNGQVPAVVRAAWELLKS